ncbi:MAG: hypothetical protein LWX02_06320 [Deltaproteobacteria bacterium]|jgi:hypothetical protein|nr:hypothetical protein [Deltaproteobacteria bacterium]MDL1988272.1 hypothetical protein [Deltaproteobacteria bacterium]
MPDSNWTQKGATLSDKSARKEFGLTQEKIIDAIKCEKLQYRQNHIHGNPYFRLLRTEVESLAKELFGEDHLKNRKLQNELSQVNKEIRRLKKQMKTLEERKAGLLRSIVE